MKHLGLLGWVGDVSTTGTFGLGGREDILAAVLDIEEQPDLEKGGPALRVSSHSTSRALPGLRGVAYLT
jgi:hypothetical protein